MKQEFQCDGDPLHWNKQQILDARHYQQEPLGICTTKRRDYFKWGAFKHKAKR
jgi:hypothetical protein